MMMNSKNILGAVVIVGVLMAPVLVLGQTATTTSNINQTICEKAVGLLDSFSSKVSQKKIDLDNKIQERLDNLTQKRQEIDQKVQALRLQWEKNRAFWYAKLLERAQIEEQKQAVEQFKITVQTAIDQRKTKIDQAQVKFRADFDQAMAERKIEIEKAVGDYKASIETAFTKAQASCGKGTSMKTVRANLQSANKKAKDSYETAKNGVVKWSETVGGLVQDRNDAIKKAQDEFKQVVDQAKNVLKAVFGEPVENATTTIPTL